MERMNRNATKWDYNTNCLGYSLGIKDWVHMRPYMTVSHDAAAQHFIKQNGFKQVQKKDMVLGKEYIAFRITTRDYHFIRRNATGHWSHKRGGQPVVTISQKEVFAEKWYPDYYGKIWLVEV